MSTQLPPIAPGLSPAAVQHNFGDLSTVAEFVIAAIAAVILGTLLSSNSGLKPIGWLVMIVLAVEAYRTETS